MFAGVICVILISLFVLVCFWNVVSVVFVPVFMCFVVVGVSMFVCNFNQSTNKIRNFVVLALSTSFFLLSVYLSMKFPSSMSGGEHFRNFLPFLDVTFY